MQMLCGAVPVLDTAPLFARYARRTTAVLARAGTRRATVIERICREMSGVSRQSDREGDFPYPIVAGMISEKVRKL